MFSEENLGKFIILADFSQKLTKHALIFLRLDEQENVLEILTKFSKF